MPLPVRARVSRPGWAGLSRVSRTVAGIGARSTGILDECGSAACTRPIQALCGCDLDPFTDYSPEPRVSLLGQQTIDQQPTFHLRFTITGGPLPSTTDIWIDRSTYLPVREKLVVPKTSVKNSPPPYTVTSDFTWFPRTSANLAQLTLVIPRGFKRSNPNP